MKIQFEVINLESHEYCVTSEMINNTYTTKKPKCKVILNGKDVSDSVVGIIFVKKEGLSK